jgi:hypothetical protein
MRHDVLLDDRDAAALVDLHDNGGVVRAGQRPLVRPDQFAVLEGLDLDVHDVLFELDDVPGLQRIEQDSIAPVVIRRGRHPHVAIRSRRGSQAPKQLVD